MTSGTNQYRWLLKVGLAVIALCVVAACSSTTASGRGGRDATTTMAVTPRDQFLAAAEAHGLSWALSPNSQGRDAGRIACSAAGMEYGLAGIEDGDVKRVPASGEWLQDLRQLVDTTCPNQHSAFEALLHAHAQSDPHLLTLG